MDKFIVITESINLLQHFKKIMKQSDFVIETEPLLYDINAIKKEIAVRKNTSNIRVQFGDYIKKNGTPPLLALDYMVDLGLDKSLDPDKRKLLRTFLISYAILYQGKGYIKKNNIIVLIGEEQYEKQLKVIKAQPHLLFKLAKTENEQVNQFLKKYAENPSLTKELFSIDYIIKPENGVIQGQLHKIMDLISKVKRQSVEIKTESRKESPESIVSPVNQQPREVKLLYLSSDEKFYINGQIFSYDKMTFGELIQDALYVEGDWWSINQLEVVKSISNFFNKVLRPIWLSEKKKDEVMPISIYLSERVSIESGMLPSLIQLIENDLIKIGKVNLFMSQSNREKLVQAAGFRFLEPYFLQSI